MALISKMGFLFWSGVIGMQGFLNDHPVMLDVFDNINKASSTTQSRLKSISKGLFIVIIIIAGILLAFGNRISSTAKSLLMYALAGVSVVALATSLVPAVANIFGWHI
ncbi:hypothetical protein [Lactobacillus bombicola]|nr:hypothetical protein [Lactobacillus bombicola]